MSRFVARLKVQEKMQVLRETSAASSNGSRQLAAACSLKRADIVVQTHRMSRSLKRNSRGLKIADPRGIAAISKNGIVCALAGRFQSILYWNCTETIFETPASCMVTPYKVSAASIVRLLCVISRN